MEASKEGYYSFQNVEHNPESLRNLVIDSGNTRVKTALFENGKLLRKWTSESFDGEEILDRATNHAVENVILSTVGSTPSQAWEEEMSRRFYYRQLDIATPLPIDNRYDTPATLGKDRLAAVIGAWALYPGRNCLVVDAGTCMTLDVVSSEGAYLGGNISPGIQMRLRAMHEYTARLPLVDEGSGEGPVLGRSTETALQNGGVLGAALEIDALRIRLMDQFSDLLVVITGGDASVLANRVKSRIFEHSNLVLEGLNKILEYNVEELRA